MIARDLLDRLLPKFVVGDDCWEWQAARDKNGYGYIWIGPKVGQMGMAHRVVYEQFVGPIPDGLHLDHLCRNTRCVNPDHLEPVTPKENLRRGVNVGDGGVRHARAKTHCPQGHPYDEENTLMWRGWRLCRACRKATKLMAKMCRS